MLSDCVQWNTVDAHQNIYQLNINRLSSGGDLTNY